MLTWADVREHGTRRRIQQDATNRQGAMPVSVSPGPDQAIRAGRRAALRRRPGTSLYRNAVTYPSPGLVATATYPGKRPAMHPLR